MTERTTSSTTKPRHDAKVIFDQQFFEMRWRCLSLAADFDRIDRAEGAVGDDPRMTQLREAIGVLLSEEPERAERVQMIFSDR